MYTHSHCSILTQQRSALKNQLVYCSPRVHQHNNKMQSRASSLLCNTQSVQHKCSHTRHPVLLLPCRHRAVEHQRRAVAAAAPAESLDVAAAQQLSVTDEELQSMAAQAREQGPVVVEQPDPNAALWQQLSFSSRCVCLRVSWVSAALRHNDKLCLIAIHLLCSLLCPCSLVLVCRHSLADSQGRLLLKNLTYAELEEWCVAAGAIEAAHKELLLKLCTPAQLLGGVCDQQHSMPPLQPFLTTSCKQPT